MFGSLLFCFLHAQIATGLLEGIRKWQVFVSDRLVCSVYSCIHFFPPRAQETGYKPRKQAVFSGGGGAASCRARCRLKVL